MAYSSLQQAMLTGRGDSVISKNRANINCVNVTSKYLSEEARHMRRTMGRSLIGTMELMWLTDGKYYVYKFCCIIFVQQIQNYVILTK